MQVAWPTLSDLALRRTGPAEAARIRREALRQPDRSPRELSCWLIDHAGVVVSESTVYRVLKRHGLIRPVTVRGFPAGPEYRVKATRPNEQWQSDGSYFFSRAGAGTT